ncbi:hypothetical protein LJK87_25675 [Paenibacillus sp. P25]|nr:hypothetical protein LJK87_25675 [Paenibacillus sp. P25]
MNDSLRQSLFELNPFLLQRIGLVRTLSKLVEMESGTDDLEIEFVSSGDELIELQDMDTKRHLFRMVQELINNAKKHSGAGLLRIELSAAHRRIRLYYNDDGVGFDIEAAEEKARLRSISGSGLGLEQMRSRVLHLGGQFELRSTVGNGVTITIHIPLKEVISA